MSDDPVVIVGMARTPMGGLLGALSPVKATELGTAAIRAALEQSGVPGADVDEVLMGCVLPAGLGQAPARQAARNAGIPDSTGAVTLNKMCGSGMKAMMIGHDEILAGSNDIIVAGGMENMSRAPFLMPNGRTGVKYGHTTLYDHMALDGLEDAYDPGRAMGTYAEDTAEKYQFTRDAQDAFAIESLRRAKLANEDGTFKGETTAVTIKTRKGEVLVSQDEQPLNARPDKIPNLRPAFRKDGTVTAANSSSISDGAAALILMRLSDAEKRGLTPIAKIVGHTTHAQAPEWFTTAPIGAIEKLYAKTGLTKDDVDLYEVNEAFAVVTMAAMRDLDIPHSKVNVHGGACALGHPIGASGARICVTLLAALQKYGLKRGIASLCIGGGEATAIALELM